MRRCFPIVVLLILPATLQGEPSDPQTLAGRIDQLMAARWKADGVQPAGKADDAEFLRRAALDLVGRIPRVADVRDFRADADPRKRRKAIEALLADPRHAVHFTNVWRSLLVPETSSG